MKHYQVMIVGAGPAGISAAARLLENNVDDLIILEAENRIGGRVHTCDLGESFVELGAEWIHGEKNNSVYELASKFNLACTLTPDTIFQDTNFYETEGRQVDKDVSRKLNSLFLRIMYAEPSQMKGSSLGEYFAAEYWNGINELRSDIGVVDALASKFLDIFEKWENTIDASDSWYKTSLMGHLEYWECEGNIVTNWNNVGYKTIFDLLEKNPPYGSKSLKIMDKVKLNKEVTKIRWNQKGLKEVPNIIIECSDKSIYSADYVISTLSLGVLKEQAGTLFSPLLDAKKLNCVEGLGFGTVDKIFLKFPYAWWTDDTDGFAFLWSDEDKKTDSTGWLSNVVAFHPVNPGSNILRGWIAGEPAKYMETLSVEEVLDGCMQLLNKFLGFKYKIPKPESIARTTWYSNSHFRGSYSCRYLESDRRNAWASQLAEPICTAFGKPILLFAGEATHDHYFSTVHGAIDSGRREADRILSNSMDQTQTKDTYEVVIIGAGISGLAAARTLQEVGITDVVILEAQDVPGGRIRSVKVGDDWLELGAQWIHGEKNEVFDLCVKHDLVTEEYSQEGEGVYLRENGEVIDEDIIKEVDDVIKTILEDCEEYVSWENRKVPVSVGVELLNKYGDYLDDCNDSNEVKKLKKDLFYWHIRFQLIDNSCDDLNDLSAKAWGLYRFCGGNDYINFKNGYISVINALISEIPDCKILYSSPVELIEWDEIVEESHVMNGGVNSSGCSGNHAKVICRDGVSFNTNYVVVTCSLGCLKSNHEKMFSPPLPDYLTEAICSLGYGILGKIFLIYEEAWWDPEVKGFQLVWSEESIARAETWAVDVTGFDVIIPNKPILLGWIGGEGARTIESMSEEDIGADSTEVLRRFTGNSEIPLPKKILKSTWYNNEYVKGGYSHITVKYDKNAIDGSNLTRPVYTTVIKDQTHFKKPTIVLAGEAAHKSHFSTVHGAYESGANQARIIAKDAKMHKSQEAYT